MTRITAAAAVAGLLAGSLLVSCDRGERGDGTATTAPTTSTTAAGTTTTVAPTASTPPAVRARQVAAFEQPVMVAPIPGRRGAFYVVERPGRLVVLEGGQRGDVVLDITAQVSGGGERGLLGLAIAPDAGHLYLDYTDVGGDTRIVEYAIERDGSVRSGSRRELLHVDQPFPNHNGGHLAFGPDGMLYIALGDGGSGGDPEGNAQNLGTLLGKILRVDPRGEPYTVPRDNPFAGTAGARPEIWAYGLRNPWRFSFDRATGTLWIGDVGQSSVEEIDRAPDGSRGGENYGWDRLEGSERFEGSPPASHVLPLAEYPRTNGNCAVTGGHVYRGSAIAGLAGWYLFGDYCRGDLLAVRADATRPADPVELGVTIESFVSLADDGTGELFALSLDGGVYRLEAASS